MHANVRRITAMLCLVGVPLAVAGLFFGLSPVANCGSPWSPDYSAVDRQVRVDALTDAMIGRAHNAGDWRQVCRDAYGSRSGLGIALLTLGIASLIGGGVAWQARKPAQSGSGISASPTGCQESARSSQKHRPRRTKAAHLPTRSTPQPLH
jgi:hypothetical protein